MKMLVGKILGSVLNDGNLGNYSVLSAGIRETNPGSSVGSGWSKHMHGRVSNGPVVKSVSSR
jgi:hypothetical protein